MSAQADTTHEPAWAEVHATKMCTLVGEPFLMPVVGSVTSWIAELKRGEEEAAQKMWERYVGRLVELARSKLRSTSRRAADEEDIAAMAFENFWQGLQDGRFPRLADRNDLWQILVMLTDRRATDHRRRAQVRARQEIGESGLAVSKSPRDITQIADESPDPDFAVLFAESIERLLEDLEDESLRQVALWKLEGFTNEEIAGKLGCVRRTVERKLQIIREYASRELGPVRDLV